MWGYGTDLISFEIDLLKAAKVAIIGTCSPGVKPKKLT
jgi:hypothetical protein